MDFVFLIIFFLKIAFSSLQTFATAMLGRGLLGGAWPPSVFATGFDFSK